MNFWQTERVRLRGVRPEDAQHFFAWNADGETARNLDWEWPPVALAQVQHWAEEQSRKKLEDDAFHWVIEALDDEAVPAGSISTHACNPRNGTCTYGLHIATPFRRRGYVSEAVGIVLRYYFDELRYQKVTVSIHQWNTASVALHERLGFVHEGTMRRMIFSRGQVFDVLWYGLTRDEWKSHVLA